MPLTMDQRRFIFPTFTLALLLLQTTASAIDLSRLYGHMDPVPKRSGKYIFKYAHLSIIPGLLKCQHYL